MQAAVPVRGPSPPAPASWSDFDLHGLIGIRLVDAASADVAAVQRQLGIGTSALDREPDIVIRFVDRLRVGRDLRYLGLDDVAFTDDAFLVLRGKHKSRVRVHLPFDALGRQCEMVCERGLPAVPFLIPIINLTLVAKGILPLHAAAFSYRGVGVLVTGWSKGGKTESLLSFMEQGAKFVGDEWVYIDPTSNAMYGIPEPVRVWGWQLDQLPRLRRRLAWAQRARLRALDAAVEGIDSTSRLTARVPTTLRRAQALLATQQFVNVAPGTLFDKQRCPLRGHVDRLFLVVSDAETEVKVRPIDGSQVARRMVHSLQYERRDLLAAYRQFRFAFPTLRNALLERVAELESDLLVRALGDHEAYLISHPYPVRIRSLFEAMVPVLPPARAQGSTETGGPRVAD